MKKLLLLLCVPLIFSCMDRNTDNLQREITFKMREGGYTGKGTHTWPFGYEYVGEWKDGKYHGTGTQSWSGITYRGEWKNGKKHGEGAEIIGTSVTVGFWKDGQLKSTTKDKDGVWIEDINQGGHSAMIQSVIESHQNNK